eukprot:jgi/Phyca11/17483/fgenesh1_pg.PHYCAscaffold_28_\
MAVWKVLSSTQTLAPFCSQPCVEKIYPTAKDSTPAVMTSSTVRAATSSSASRNIWAGSDSDFVPSPEVAVASDTAVVRPVKRRKVAAKGKVAKKAKSVEAFHLSVPQHLSAVLIVVLATVKNDGHNAPLMAKVIESGFKAKYDIDIRAMTRFTMSDTTPSARNVADHIDSEQEDCSMHLLNLCIGYGIGLKDNIQTNITPGGSLEKGGEVIQKLRNLNNHFRSPKQRNALKKIQEALSYPELDPMTDKDKIAAVGNVSRKEEKATYKNGLEFLRDEHRKVFAQMAKVGKMPLSQTSSQSSLLSQDLNSPLSSPSSTGWDDEDELLLGAPIRTSKTREEVKESELNARADSIMNEWLEMEPEWLEIAQRQNPETKKEDLSSAMTTDSRTDSRRSEKQLLLRHNRNEIVMMCYRLFGGTINPWFPPQAGTLLAGDLPEVAVDERVHSELVSPVCWIWLSSGRRVVHPFVVATYWSVTKDHVSLEATTIVTCITNATSGSGQKTQQGALRHSLSQILEHSSRSAFSASPPLFPTQPETAAGQASTNSVGYKSDQ